MATNETKYGDESVKCRNFVIVEAVAAVPALLLAVQPLTKGSVWENVLTVGELVFIVAAIALILICCIPGKRR